MNVTSVTDVGLGDLPDTPELLACLPSGTTVGGKYVIQGVLGCGGNGTVYKAEHTAIGHRVAIKVCHPSLSGTAEVLARFGREARICGSLRHPNIGQVYDVGLLDNGAPYMVMELQEGLSLADILAEMTLSFTAIIELARQLLCGLSAAHRAGVVHRDVKPGNVMVVRDANGEIVVKLVDFGICKQLHPTAGSTVTQRGMMVGSPDYMAPEQLRGEEVDPRTDVYAVGALLYEAITGRTPFDGQTTADLLVSILQAPLEPPSRYREDCPPELQLVVLAALSRDRARRPPSAEEMARALALVPLRGADHDTGASLAKLRERLGPGTPAAMIARPTTAVAAMHALRARILLAARKVEPMLRRPALRVALGPVLVPLVIAAVYAGQSADRPSASRPVTANVVQPKSTGPTAVASARVTASENHDAPSAQPASTEGTGSESSVAANEPAPAASVAGASHSDARARVKSPVAYNPAVQALLKAAATAFVHGRTADARELYLQVLAREPGRPEALRGLGLALSRMGRTQEAARAFERYLELRPNAADAERIRALLETLRTPGRASAAASAAG